MTTPTARLQAAKDKMAAAGVNPISARVFEYFFNQLVAGHTGIIAEADVDPLPPPAQPELAKATDEDIEAFSKTAIIRLNGGLGTSMGLSKAKSLLPIWEGHTFLDVIVRQVTYAREHYGVQLPLLFMHSDVTREDCLAALGQMDVAVDGLPLDFVQAKVPRLRADDLSPVEWPAAPNLEWCPPGHGDIFPSLMASGVIDQLINAGFYYVSVSNSDNLGCAPSPVLAGWFARSGAPYAAEVTLRTPMDLKGGHIVRRKADGQLILRETAQTAPEEMRYFTDAEKHPYTHTNNLWFDLRVLRARLAETGGVLGLPLIRNEKVVDPRADDAPKVIQLESAMGAAIEVFDGAQAVAVPRSRFLPVKTTTELTLLRSDVYSWEEAWVPRATVDPLPVVELSKYYKHLADFEQRLPYPLGLTEARALRVRGDWAFGSDIRAVGEVELDDAGGRVPDGIVLRGE